MPFRLLPVFELFVSTYNEAVHAHCTSGVSYRHRFATFLPTITIYDKITRLFRYMPMPPERLEMDFRENYGHHSYPWASAHSASKGVS